MITTTQADQEGLVIKEPLTIIATTGGPYIDSGDNIIAAPPNLVLTRPTTPSESSA
jgi:hypothetical protein